MLVTKLFKMEGKTGPGVLKIVWKKETEWRASQSECQCQRLNSNIYIYAKAWLCVVLKRPIPVASTSLRGVHTACHRHEILQNSKEKRSDESQQNRKKKTADFLCFGCAVATLKQDAQWTRLPQRPSCQIES